MRSPGLLALGQRDVRAANGDHVAPALPRAFEFDVEELRDQRLRRS
jgi:hypothetical protein